MSYSANQYNYATPLSSTAGLVQETSGVTDANYFTLFDNKLDGNYVPISGDVGLWGAALSDANGVLSQPFVVTIVENLTVNAFRLTGSSESYPVAFTVKFYNGTSLLHTITETANNKIEYLQTLPNALTIDKYEISITKVSSANSVARLYNVYNPAYVKRADTLRVKSTETSERMIEMLFKSVDAISVGSVESSLKGVNVASTDNAKVTSSESVKNIQNSIEVNDSLNVRNNDVSSIYNKIDITTDSAYIGLSEGKSGVTNIINVTKDTLISKIIEDRSYIINNIKATPDELKVASEEQLYLTNVHSAMKEPSRHIYGKVLITYTDPMLETETTITTSDGAYNSNTDQMFDAVAEQDALYFVLYDNDLTGAYVVSTEESQIGWVSKAISGADGTFAEPQFVHIDFSPRPIFSKTIVFDASHGSVAEDFTVTFTDAAGEEYVDTYTGNTEATVEIQHASMLNNIVSMHLEITKVSKPYYPVAILEIPISSTVLYRGYDNVSDLIGIDLLEELTYEDEIEALGGVSANEITVKIDNSNKEFFFNSGSIVSKQLKRNRKIEPWLGVELEPGVVEWYTLGTFWSHKWDVPVNSLAATVVGFDTIGLLGLTDYHNHTVQTNKSIGELVEYVLDDAKSQLDFIEYDIDEALYDIIIPYAWFEHGSHAAALRKISTCFPMHIYCDRQGRICAKPQKLRVDWYYDTWSDDTNIISKNYSSLYTALPNIVNVSVNKVSVASAAELARDERVHNIVDAEAITLNFSSPYVMGLVVDVDCDGTLTYTYETFSWGITVTFTGTGNVRSIVCTGQALNVENGSVITKKDDVSIRIDGAYARTIQADFIQTYELAQMLVDRIFSLSEYDKYDATVQYRGDIALSINDPILLNDGIAPDNRYNIKRHQLSWNGALTGSAELNT